MFRAFAYILSSFLVLLAIEGAFFGWAAMSPAETLRPDLLAVEGHRFVNPAAAVGPGATVTDSPQTAASYGVAAAALAAWPDQSRAVLLGGGPRTGAALLDLAATRLHATSRSSSSGGGIARVGLSTSEGAARGIASGQTAILVLAPDAARAQTHLDAMPLYVRSEGNYASRLMRDHSLYIFAGTLVLCLLWVAIMPRLGSAAVARAPNPGAAPVDAGTLGQRLLAINQYDVPFAVTQGQRPGQFFVEWRYRDATWLGLLVASGSTAAARLEIRLDERSHTARELDVVKETDWRAGPGAIQFSSSLFRGIVLKRYDRGIAYGLRVTPGGLSLQPYQWRFDIDEMKQPIIDIIASAGWSWRPVMAWTRLLSG